MYGNCVSCGFPVSVKDVKGVASCPYCSTANKPIEAEVGQGWEVVAALAVPLAAAAVILGAFVMNEIRKGRPGKT